MITFYRRPGYHVFWWRAGRVAWLRASTPPYHWRRVCGTRLVFETKQRHSDELPF